MIASLAVHDVRDGPNSGFRLRKQRLARLNPHRHQVQTERARNRRRGQFEGDVLLHRREDKKGDWFAIARFTRHTRMVDNPLSKQNPPPHFQIGSTRQRQSLHCKTRTIRSPTTQYPWRSSSKCLLICLTEGKNICAQKLIRICSVYKVKRTCSCCVFG